MAVSSNRWVVALGLVIGCGEPRWERVAAMQHPRAAHAVVATQDTIVALAGIDGAGAPVLAVEREGVKVAFLPLGESHIELVQPTREDTGIVKWMSKHGAGMHHVCVEVSDIDAKLAELAAKGIELINPQAITRDNGTRYAFIHPRSAFGVLVELYEVKS